LKDYIQTYEIFNVSHDSVEAAEDVLNGLVEISNSLIQQPARGSLPKELLAL